LFGERRLTEIRIPSGKPGVDGAKALETYAGRLPVDTLTLVSLPGLDWKTMQSRWFAALAKSGVVVEARPVDRAALPNWIDRRLIRQGLRAERAALDFLADQVEGNLLAAQQEIDKLALLLPPGTGRWPMSNMRWSMSVGSKPMRCRMRCMRVTAYDLRRWSSISGMRAKRYRPSCGRCHRQCSCSSG